DVVSDFNITGIQPAVGYPFTYGTETSLNVGFTLLPQFINSNIAGTGEVATGGTLNCYYFAQPWQLDGPAISEVAIGDTVTMPSNIPLVIPNDILLMGPGGPQFNAPDLVVTRFTAPSAGVFDITGSFTDLSMASVDLTIVIDGTTVFSSSFSGQ